MAEIKKDVVIKVDFDEAVNTEFESGENLSKIVGKTKKAIDERIQAEMDDQGKTQLYQMKNGERVDLNVGGGGGAPYVYMNQSEYESLTEYEPDQMYWVTYPCDDWLVWKNGKPILGQGVVQPWGDSSPSTSITVSTLLFLGTRLAIAFNPTSRSIQNDYRYPNLKSISFANNVTSIGDYAFSYCKSLLNITISDSVTSIGFYAFSNCSSLTSVIIPDSVTSIGESAFSYCKSLLNVTISDSVTSIGNSVFNSCSSLTSVIIPDSVTSIGGSAFDSCSSLTSVIIPDSVTSIGGSAFSNCRSLAHIYFRGTQQQWNSISKGSNWNYGMGSNVSGGTQIIYNYEG